MECLCCELLPVSAIRLCTTTPWLANTTTPGSLAQKVCTAHNDLIQGRFALLCLLFYWPSGALLALVVPWPSFLFLPFLSPAFSLKGERRTIPT